MQDTTDPTVDAPRSHWWRFLPVVILSVVSIAGLAFAATSKDQDAGDLYEGQIEVGLTGSVPASGVYQLQNIFPPNIREITAVIQFPNAKPGIEVETFWYQMGVTRPDGFPSPDGRLFTEAGFTLYPDSINPETKRGGNTVRLTVSGGLPEDSYMIKIFIDGKLARLVPFVVSSRAAPARP